MKKVKKSVKKNSQRVLSVGNTVLIRTVTHYQTGRIVEVGDGWVVLEDAAWIASTGRFADALKTGELDEVEPCSDLVEVMTGAMVDVYHWRHPLPRTQK